MKRKRPSQSSSSRSSKKKNKMTTQKPTQPSDATPPVKPSDPTTLPPVTQPPLKPSNNDASKTDLPATAAKYSLIQVRQPVPGDINGDFRYYFQQKNHGPINPLHDIPLYADCEAGILNFVVEIPRWTNAKLELCTKKQLAPIVQDMKKGKKRYVHNVYPYKGYIWNYGCFPQTWEDPTQVHMETGALGDGDPLDVCEIGKAGAKVGEVMRVKVLGVLGMIDEGEMDWKVIVVNVEDSLAKEVDDVGDLYRVVPGLLHATFSWFRTYKVPDGKALNVFAFRERVQPKEYAFEIIEECHESWKKLIQGKVQNKKIDCVNTTLKESKFCIDCGKAKSIVESDKAEAAARSPETGTESGGLHKSGSMLDMTQLPLPDFASADGSVHGSKAMMTIKRFCTKLQRDFPHGSNDLSLLVTELGVAFKCVRAQLCDAPNAAFSALSTFANSQIHASLASSGLCCLIYSSLSPSPMALEPGVDVGNYIVVYNPLSGVPGSSLGSVFSVYYRKSAPGKEGDTSDLLQRPGYDQVAAGYCMYGATTCLVFSMGYGVHSFALDVVSGHFVLAKEFLTIPEQGSIYSIDISVLPNVVDGVRKFVDELESDGSGRKFRHYNNVVANFHSVLLQGGILMLPGPQKKDLAKYLSEAAPLAFVARQAGGRASVGKRNLLELSAWSLQMSVPVFVGSPSDVDRIEELVLGHAVKDKNRINPGRRITS